jgi:hypothetical protein
VWYSGRWNGSRRCYRHAVGRLIPPLSSGSIWTFASGVAAVGRRVNTLCTGEDRLGQQLVVFQNYHNFCLPHASLRIPLKHPAPTNGAGSAKRWRPCTPAMAAGLTDHVWSFRDVLLFRVPPWPQAQAL